MPFLPEERKSLLDPSDKRLARVLLQPRQLAAAAGVAEEDWQLVADELAAAASENGRTVGQARPRLLTAVGRELSEAAAVCGDGAKDCHLAGGDGVYGGGVCSDNQPTG